MNCGLTLYYDHSFDTVFYDILILVFMKLFTSQELTIFTTFYLSSIK